MALVACTLWSGCDTSLIATDNIYSRGADHRVLCSLSVDDKTSVSVDALAAGFDRAQVERKTIHLYTHSPEGDVQPSTIESVLAGAADRGLAFVTYRELAAGAVVTGLAFSFDDRDLEGWTPLRPLFDRYRAKVTFFISRYHTFDDLAKQQLRALADDGHDIQYHSTNHENADDYSSEHGVAAYLADSILPDLELMRADGYAPDVFAYPFGARTAATDAALLEHFELVRSNYYFCPY